MRTAGGREEGLEYFRADAAQDQDWLDPRMARSIVIWSAPNYAKLSESWALKSLVHEFGHAQHLEHWPEGRADIYDTWDRAVKAGLYQVVREEDKGTHNPNYAAQNHLEYFAELTAIYFVGAHYFPYDRAGLKAYDPAGYALIETLWGLNEAPAAASPEGNERGLPMNGLLYLSAADLRRACRCATPSTQCATPSGNCHAARSPCPPAFGSMHPPNTARRWSCRVIPAPRRCSR